MEQEKPFKTIEVIDSRTNQLCKVACMSCIRGHRTTSCGIPVCRTKVFWTVKRPGRPSNSCTCRYGATGGCKCVVARTACPHKTKKGEKRPGECRCEEQGRYCCLIEPQHWDQLLALGKPTVDFYPTRKALESRFATSAPTPTSLPMTPAFSNSTPSTFGSGMSTPAVANSTSQTSMMSTPYSDMHSPRSSLTPRFGMMGIEAPQGSQSVITPDLLSWDGQAPPAPRTARTPHHVQEEQSSCCQGPSSPQPETQYANFSTNGQQPLTPSFPPFGEMMPNITMPGEPQPAQAPIFDFNKLSNDYFRYQFPSAICQTCGLNGCTCRNCPPVMQNFSTGSWAQCCGRKHARTAAYVPETAPVQFQQPAPAPPPPSDFFPEQLPPSQYIAGQDRSIPHSHGSKRAYPSDVPAQAFEDVLSPPHSLPDFSEFDPGEDFVLPEGAENIDLSEFLMAELEQPRPPEQGQRGGVGGGCCCGGGEGET